MSIHVNDIGHTLRYIAQDGGIPFDFSAGGPFGVPTAVVFRIRKGDGSILQVTPTITTPAGGVLSWTNTLITDFNVPGLYRVLPRVTFAGGQVYHFDSAVFEVKGVY
jgi:hypothetical protein